MESKDTLGTIAADNSASNDTVFLIIIFIIMVGIILYMLFKPKKETIVVNDTTSSTIPKDNKSTPSKENKEVKVEFEKPTEVAKPKNETVAIPFQTETKKEIIEPAKATQPILKKLDIVAPEIEEQSKEKYIGYKPINIFAQTEPLSFPYVMMPKPNCVIKFPRKGRTGRKGFKEEVFKEYIEKHFKNNYQVFDDRFILIKNSTRPYEPDFSLINEKNGVNIFVDIEIDEPYEGTNDIENRKPTHYKYTDTNRNLAFINRGWIVIRFAEIQVHHQPDACCQFVAHILKSINSNYAIPESLQSINKIQPLLQWTEEEAKQWSLVKYRESYLGIDRFGVTSNDNLLVDIEETELGEAIEEQVVGEEIQIINPTTESLDKLQKLFMASVTGKFISCSINNEKTMFQPTYVYEHETSGFCYVKNDSRTFRIADMENIEVKDNYYTQQIAGHQINVEQISNIVNTAIDYKKYIRMKYTRIGWRNNYVDTETGEYFENIVEAEESIRTISDVQLSINALDQEHIQNYRLNSNYLTAYCHKREEQRTFKFDRISEIEILDI